MQIHLSDFQYFFPKYKTLRPLFKQITGAVMITITVFHSSYPTHHLYLTRSYSLPYINIETQEFVRDQSNF